MCVLTALFFRSAFVWRLEKLSIQYSQSFKENFFFLALHKMKMQKENKKKIIKKKKKFVTIAIILRNYLK